jgi:hypothetical protein
MLARVAFIGSPDLRLCKRTLCMDLIVLENYIHHFGSRLDIEQV